MEDTSHQGADGHERRFAMIRVGFAMAGHSIPPEADELAARMRRGEITLDEAKREAFARFGA